MKSSSVPMHQRRSAATTNSGNSVASSNSHFNSRNNSGSNNNMYSRNNNNSNNIDGYNDTNANILEQQNNEHIDQLSSQITRLKHLTIDIGNEVQEQNSLLDSMGDGFQSTKDLLQQSLGRIGTMLQSGGSKHMCYMISFIVFAMVFLYWVMAYRRA